MTVMCPYCDQEVEAVLWVDHRFPVVVPHKDYYPLRWCEGGNRRVVVEARSGATTVLLGIRP